MNSWPDDWARQSAQNAAWQETTPKFEARFYSEAGRLKDELWRFGAFHPLSFNRAWYEIACGICGLPRLRARAHNARAQHQGIRMIVTREDVQGVRHRLGWSIGLMADALRLSPTTGAQYLREVERGRRDVSGPLAVALEAIDSGFRPEGFDAGEAVE